LGRRRIDRDRTNLESMVAYLSARGSDGAFADVKLTQLKPHRAH